MIPPSVEISSAFKQQESEDSTRFELKKKLGLWDGVALIAGTVVGTGIFVSPVGVLSGSNGSIGVSLLLWVACGLFCAMVALCYAELGTTIRESGSNYAYINATYGGTVAFMFVISGLFVGTPAARAANSIVFGTYMTKLFYEGCDPPVAAIKFAAASAILIIGLLNYLSVKSASRVQIAFTTLKFLGMLIIIIAGFVRLGMGDPVGISNLKNAFDVADIAGITAGEISIALYQGLYAYIGWSILNCVTEEVKDVSKTLPRAIMTSMGMVTLFYIMINVAYFSVLTPAEMLSSKAVAVTFASKAFPSAAGIIPIVVTISIFGGLNGGFLAGARVIFAAGRRGHLPQVLSMIHVAHNTPGPAILIQAAMCLLLIIPGDIDTLISMCSFTVWINFGLIAAAVLILRRKYPQLHRPYKVPTSVPIIVIFFALLLVVVPLVSKPKVEYMYGLAVMLSAPIVYYLLIHRKYRVPGYEALTSFMQLVLDVAPTDWTDSLDKDGNNKD